VGKICGDPRGNACVAGVTEGKVLKEERRAEFVPKIADKGTVDEPQGKLVLGSFRTIKTQKRINKRARVN